MADIFLSYAREDLAAVERLVAGLTAAGQSVWYDQTIRGGADFGEETTKAIECAKKVLVVWSKSSVGSKWVRDEAAYGRDKTELIPISLDGSEPPLGFRQIQTIDFSQESVSPESRAFSRLLAALAGESEGPTQVSVAGSPIRFLRSRNGAIAAAATLLAVLAGTVLFARIGDRPVSKTAESAAAVQTQPAAKSVAVLPFLALSSDIEDGHFADGLSEQIIDSLTTIPGLLVTARTSAFHFKGSSSSIAEIADALGVAHVVEGSVRRAGGKVRITAQLIRAADGFHLWSNSYDRAADDIFGVQSDIAERVAGALGVLLDEKQRRVMNEQGVKDVEAYAAYHKGAQLFYEAHAYGPFMAKAKEAQPYFEAAFTAAPDFAEARLMHAVIYERLLKRAIYGGPPPKEFEPRTAEQLQQLLLDDLAGAERDARTSGRRAMAAYARALSSDDWTGLAAKMDAALAGKECLANLGWVSEAALFGRLDAAIGFIERRKACDPFDPGAYGTIIDLHMHRRNFEEARANIEKGRALFGPRPPYAYSEFVAAVGAGRFREAHAFLDGLDAGWRPFGGLMLALQEGDAAAAAAAREKLVAENFDVDLLIAAAWTGDRAAASRIAADIDSRPFGRELLTDAAFQCYCGSPFPIEATPNFAKRLQEAELPWTPPAAMDWPAKDW